MKHRMQDQGQTRVLLIWKESLLLFCKCVWAVKHRQHRTAGFLGFGCGFILSVLNWVANYSFHHGWRGKRANRSSGWTKIGAWVLKLHDTWWAVFFALVEDFCMMFFSVLLFFFLFTSRSTSNSEKYEYFHKSHHVTVLCCLWQKCQMVLSRLLKWRSWQLKLKGNLWGEHKCLSHNDPWRLQFPFFIFLFSFFVCDSCLKAHLSKTPLNCGYSIYEGQPSSDKILFPQTVKVIVISPEKSWKDML